MCEKKKRGDPVPAFDTCAGAKEVTNHYQSHGPRREPDGRESCSVSFARPQSHPAEDGIERERDEREYGVGDDSDHEVEFFPERTKNWRLDTEN